MNETPRTYTLTIAAGAIEDIFAFHKMVTFLDVSAGATLQWAIGEDSFQEITEGIGYELPGGGDESRIRLYNVGAASVTVKVVLSIGRVYDNRAEISEALASIDDRLAGVSALTQLPKTNVAATGGAGTLLFAANASRRLVSVTAAEDNSGYIYVGKTSGVSAADAVKVLLPGGEWYDEFYQGAVYAVGSDGAQNVFGYEE